MKINYTRMTKNKRKRHKQMREFSNKINIDLETSYIVTVLCYSSPSRVIQN